MLSKTALTNLASFPSGKNALAISMNSFMVALIGVLFRSISAIAARNSALSVGSIRSKGHVFFNDLLDYGSALVVR